MPPLPQFPGTVDTFPAKTDSFRKKRILLQRPSELFFQRANSNIAAGQKLHRYPPVIWYRPGKQLIQPCLDRKKPRLDRFAIAHRNRLAVSLLRDGHCCTQQGRERFFLPRACSDNAHAEQLR